MYEFLVRTHMCISLLRSIADMDFHLFVFHLMVEYIVFCWFHSTFENSTVLYMFWGKSMYPIFSLRIRKHMMLANEIMLALNLKVKVDVYVSKQSCVLELYCINISIVTENFYFNISFKSIYWSCSNMFGFLPYMPYQATFLGCNCL